MADQTPSNTRPDRRAPPLIGGQYGVEVGRPLDDAGGGLAAFAVSDRSGLRRDLMAVRVGRDAPARATVITALAGQALPGLLMPVAVGAVPLDDGTQAQFVIGQAPTGPSLAVAAGIAPRGSGSLPGTSTASAWGEAALLGQVLRPAAVALEALRQRHLTHRAIRPDNLFVSPAGQSTTLGGFWAAPPASRQSALWEPPYVAMCAPAARGQGSTADDVYALGVVLLVLATGRVPLADLDDDAIIMRKLEMGSFGALAGDGRLPPLIGDLIRSMLAEDPDHRPPPALLVEPAAARARRMGARPPQRAQRPLEVGARVVWDARGLAYAIAMDPDPAVTILRNGAVDRWLRRSVGDAALAVRLDDAIGVADGASSEGPRPDNVLILRAVATLDPLAPLCWRGMTLWPDAVGPVLITAAADDTRLDELLQFDLMASWADLRGERADPTAIRIDSRQQRNLARLRGWSGGRPRLRYALNPLLPCASPLLGGRAVVRLAELLPALEAAIPANAADLRPIDRELAAFIAARSEPPIDAAITDLLQPNDPVAGALALLRLLAHLQGRFAPGQTLPRLATCMARLAAEIGDTWRNRARRERIARELNDVAATGDLPALLALLDDPASRAADAREAAAAEAAVQAIDAELARIADAAPVRAAIAQRLGEEIVAAIGASALVAVGVAAAVA